MYEKKGLIRNRGHLKAERQRKIENEARKKKNKGTETSIP
jgi:hypothetical protein